MTRRAAGFAAAVLVAAMDAAAEAPAVPIPHGFTCPAGLTRKDVAPLIDAFPPIHGVSEGQHCRRSDGVPQGPTVAWHFGRKRLAMVGSYCDGQAQGHWSFFWPNGVLAREGTYLMPSLKHGIWRDYDQEGRRLVEIEFAEGREVGKWEFPRGTAAPPVDPAGADRLAVRRLEAAMALSCSATAVDVRPFRGLREELRSVDAIALVRIEAIELANRPPGWVWSDMPPPPQHVDVVVRRGLKGSLAPAGSKVRLWLDSNHLNRRFETLHAYDTFTRAQKQEAVFALVSRHGDRLEIANLMIARPDDGGEAALREYVRLARLDEDGFRLGLARLLAEVVQLRQDRLLWMGWIRLAFDDWSRLRLATDREPRLDSILDPALGTTLAQIDAFVARGTYGLNLDDLPWLIRLLNESKRRRLAAALLRLQPIFQREIDAAQKEFDQAYPPGAPEPPELTSDAMRLAAATAAMMRLVECLAVCIEPTRPPYSAPADTIERARAFVAMR